MNTLSATIRWLTCACLLLGVNGTSLIPFFEAGNQDIATQGLGKALTHCDTQRGCYGEASDNTLLNFTAEETAEPAPSLEKQSPAGSLTRVILAEAVDPHRSGLRSQAFLLTANIPRCSLVAWSIRLNA